MLKKLTIALLTSSVSAIQLDNMTFSKKALEESCSANLKRLENGKEFKGIDESFPPSQHSLFWKDHLKNDDMIYKYKEVKAWATPRELYEHTPNLWGEKGVLPTGTRQGQLGDCWFLASASSIAEYPDRIHQIFKNINGYPEADKNGVSNFEVRFYQKGRPVSVWIDDKLPLNSDGMVINSQMSKNKAWWQPILEKAYAKFHINYAQLDAGNPAQALRELTGMPVEMYDSQKQKENEFHDIIAEADKNKYVMTAACIHDVFNLVTSHAYSILGVQDLKAGDTVLHKLVKMRNPWGSERYTGPWNDKDERWTDEFKKQAKHVDANDGVFFMTIADFKKAFTVYNIALYQNWHTSMHNVKGTGKKFQAHIETPVDQNVIVTLDYQNKRQIPAGCDLPDIFYNIYIVAMNPQRLLGGGGKAVNKQVSSGNFKFEAKKGTKYVILVVNWGDRSIESDFTLTSYGEKATAEITK